MSASTGMPQKPTPWRKGPLGNFLTLQRGFDLPYRMRRPGDVPIVTSSGITDSHDRAQVAGPGVVTGRYGTIGEVFYVPVDFWPLNTTLFIRDFKKNDPLFVSYLLRTIDFASHSGKSGVPGINRNDIHKLTVLLPGEPEQKAIAAALLDMDALIGSLEELIEKKRAIKLATMQQLLTGHVRLEGFGKAAKGSERMPRDWRLASLGSLGRWRGGLTPSMANPENWTAGAIPWISSSDVRGHELTRTAACITEHAVKTTAVPVLPPDSIVVVMRSGILRRFLPVARLTRSMAVNQDIKALPPSSSFDSRFVQQMISFRGNDILATCMKAGTTVESIDTGWFKGYEIAFPKPEEQTAE